MGAERFGWARRTPEVGSMRKGDLLLGWGVAAASWGANRGVCEASVDLRGDGTARVSCGTQDIGTGSYTVIAQIVSDKTGIPVDKIDVVLGSSSLPPGPTSGGSTATSTFFPAIIDAANAAIKVVLTVASSTKGSPFAGRMGSLAFTAGRVHEKGNLPGAACPMRDTAHGESCQRQGRRKERRPGSEKLILLDALLWRAVCGGGVGSRDRPVAREPGGQRGRWRPHHQSAPQPTRWQAPS